MALSRSTSHWKWDGAPRSYPARTRLGRARNLRARGYRLRTCSNRGHALMWPCCTTSCRCQQWQSTAAMQPMKTPRFARGVGCANCCCSGSITSGRAPQVCCSTAATPRIATKACPALMPCALRRAQRFERSAATSTSATMCDTTSRAKETQAS